MNSIQEVDLVLTCKLEFMRAKEEESILSQQLETLRSQKEEIARFYELKLNNYHLATQLSETYTLDSFDPSLRHEIDCKCYMERNELIQKEFKNELSIIQNKIATTQKLHRLAKSKLTEAKRKSETLDKRILKAQKASENHFLNRRKMKQLKEKEYLISQQLGQEKDAITKRQSKKILVQTRKDLKDIALARSKTLYELRTTKELLSRYKRFLRGQVDSRGRRIQTSSPNV